MNVLPVTLIGHTVRLEPLSPAHHHDLCKVGLDEELWKITTTLIRTPGDLHLYIETALAEQQSGKSLPFAIIETSTNTAIGSTRFGNIDRIHKRVEIGWTWIARSWQRTSVNTEAKLLLLTHAFETLGCIRVEFKTDVLNQQSRNALLRIGAKEEGIFRNHMIAIGGRLRDSVYYSIIDAEWPGAKSNLQSKISERKAP